MILHQLGIKPSDSSIITATIEGRLTQQFAYLKQIPFHGIFLDLQKVYDDMDRD